MDDLLSKAEIEKLLKIEKTNMPKISNDKEHKLSSLKSFLSTSDLTENEIKLLLQDNLNTKEIQILDDVLLRSKLKTFEGEAPQNPSGKQRMSKSKYELVLQTVVKEKLMNLEVDIDKILVNLGLGSTYSSCFLSSDSIMF